MEQYAVNLPTTVILPIVMGLTFSFSATIVILFGNLLRAGRMNFALYAITVYVGLMSLLCLWMGGCAFYRAKQSPASSVGYPSIHIHPNPHDLAILSWTIGGCLILGWICSFKPFERLLMIIVQKQAAIGT